MNVNRRRKIIVSLTAVKNLTVTNRLSPAWVNSTFICQ